MKLNRSSIFIMICSLILISLLLIWACSRQAEEVKTIPQGEIDFSLPDLSGNMVNFSDFKGKVIILDFWAIWCYPCLVEIPHFIDLYNTYRLEGLEIIGITMPPGSAEDVVKKVQELNINYIILMGNNEVAQKFGGIGGYPTTFIIDKEGRIYKKYIGSRPNIKQLLEADIKSLF